MFDFFEHTADVGIRATADSLNELHEQAAQALFALIVNDLESIQPRYLKQFELQTTGDDMLLRDWLAELLYVFDAELMLFRRFEVTINEHTLSAKVYGEPYDASRHKLQREVKAVTYHGLRVWHADNQWHCEIIVDI